VFHHHLLKRNNNFSSNPRQTLTLISLILTTSNKEINPLLVFFLIHRPPIGHFCVENFQHTFLSAFYLFSSCFPFVFLSKWVFGFDKFVVVGCLFLLVCSFRLMFACIFDS